MTTKVSEQESSRIVIRTKTKQERGPFLSALLLLFIKLTARS